MSRTGQSRTKRRTEIRASEDRFTAGGGAASWRDMGRDALFGGEPAEALWFLRHALEIDRDDPVCWQLMRRCFEEIGEKIRARQCQQLAIRLSPEPGEDGERPERGPLAHPRKPREPREA